MNDPVPFPEKLFWYDFSQNNSGGHFHLDKKAGITHHVVIQARNAEDANARAEAIGIYFDGCADEIDCPCCGDRWYRTDQYDATDEPSVYDQPADDYWTVMPWMEEGYEICVHPLNGPFKFYGANKARYGYNDENKPITYRTDNDQPVYDDE